MNWKQHINSKVSFKLADVPQSQAGCLIHTM